MLSHESNERLTRVGPGTPMGRLMREYWVPALLTSELPAPDGPQLRVMLLCERLIAFRDSTGRVGLFPEACPHRGASLFLARNEHGGLRCSYHGWKFDVNGACMHLPTEPEGSPLRKNVRVGAYPCIERNGIVWAYLGPRSTPPPLPDLEVNVDGTSGRVGATMLENNWLQAVEGDIDVAHIPFLHGENYQGFARVLGNERMPLSAWADLAPPTIEVADTVAGFAYARREPPRAEPRGIKGPASWHVGHFMFPFYANLPYGPLSCQWLVARVPMDDHHTLTFGMWTRSAALPPPELQYGDEPHYLSNTTDWFGRFRLARNQGNDFQLDRERARLAGIGPGIQGQVVQDAAITASMGPIVDRRREHLGKADTAIIHLRRRLLSAVNGIDESGAPALDTPQAYRVKHGLLRVGEDGSWYDELQRRGGAGLATAPPRPSEVV